MILFADVEPLEDFEDDEFEPWENGGYMGTGVGQEGLTMVLDEEVSGDCDEMAA